MDQSSTDERGKVTAAAWPAAAPRQPGPSVEHRETLPARLEAGLPVVVAKRRARNRWIEAALLVAVLIGGAGGAYYWWQMLHPALPPGIFFGNGRLETDEINIDTKYAARIAEILADEGDMVKAGQVVARMDTRDLQASLKRSQATVSQAQKAIDEANADVAQQKAQVLLAQQEMQRAVYTVQKGVETEELLDQRRQQLDSANAALNAAQFRVTEAEHALDAASHDVELYTVEITDDSLVAPRDGRIQYRIANVGEVLPSGGHVFAMLDISDVYMDVYLPTLEAGKVKFGDEARIALDAYPDYAIPAKVSFIATQAQFTPKTVETQSERDKLMFRIRVQLDPERLRRRAESVRSGLPGVAYIKTDSAAAWPDALQKFPPQ
jgi:HlyD family secretion protein